MPYWNISKIVRKYNKNLLSERNKKKRKEMNSIDYGGSGGKCIYIKITKNKKKTDTREKARNKLAPQTRPSHQNNQPNLGNRI